MLIVSTAGDYLSVKWMLWSLFLARLRVLDLTVVIESSLALISSK